MVETVIPTITVDARRAMARFGPRGIPEQVRMRLRGTLPSIGKKLTRGIEEKLDSELKSRTRLKTTAEMRENPNEIYIKVSEIWTGASSQNMVPAVLDTGSKPHEIAAKNASVLYFFWEKLGRNVAFRRVMHPGFPGINYMKRTLAEQQREITDTLKRNVIEAMNE